jgi:hypothetical protein
MAACSLGFPDMVIFIISLRGWPQGGWGQSHVFPVVQLPEKVWIPGDEESEDPNNNTIPIYDRLPPEFAAFKDVFYKDGAKTVPSSKVTKHAITIMEGQNPPWGPIYPLSMSELKILREYIDENLACGRIRRSQSPAAAPILFVPKNDGSLRLCVDTEDSTKSQSRIDILYLSFQKSLIDFLALSILPKLI